MPPRDSYSYAAPPSAQLHEVDTPQEHDKKELVIGDRAYDVTNFVKRHPGGKIIAYQVGTDATDAYKQFHVRSAKADKMLKSLPSRPVHKGYSPRRADLIADFQEFTKQLEAEGMFEPSLPHVAYRLAEVIAMHVAGAALIWHGYTFAGIAMLGVVQGRCGWLMHEGGHYSLTGNIAFDRAIQVACYGLGCGMSGAWWRNQHNKHHATPQKLQHDVDLDTLPLVAFHERIAAKVKSPAMKAWLSMQAKLFAPVTTLLVALGWQLYLHPRHMLRTKHYDELAMLGIRYGLVGYLAANYGAGYVLACYLLYVQLGAMYIFCNFAVSHTHLPVVEPNEHATWVEYAANHTTNCSPSWWCDWWMSYLNYQIEHHLYPSMPQFRHPKIAPRVKQLFEKHGLHYDVRGYFEAMADTFANLDNVAHAPEKKMQ
uniref:Acyl-lipid (8-3)-desaturase n=1 Tax=Rebecca salina TaxID=561169 RepID=D5FAD_REBSA|nr:RecName: Full=Acyl-lipid (8-3)-desaturase; AltName: Full=AN Delta(5)-fatty-acid desaturase; AltName: Full=Acyl-lipid 5-desaturase; AltName: Full=Delta-5 desaturase [Rebecca salina]ABL96295.1 delta-5 desaturase [Rebecca salina]